MVALCQSYSKQKIDVVFLGTADTDTVI